MKSIIINGLDGTDLLRMDKTEDKQMINIAIVDDEEFWRNKIREEIEKNVRMYWLQW